MNTVQLCILCPAPGHGFVLESRGPALHSPYAGQCLGEYLPVEGEPGQFRQRHTMDGRVASYMFQ